MAETANVSLPRAATPANRSLARGLDILALLSETPRGLALHEIARALRLPKSSAFNLIHTLLEKQFLRYDADTAHYALSLRMFELGASARLHISAESVIRRYMREISTACNETVHCGVLDGMDVVYVDKVESTRSIRMSSRIGMRLPLYCTAMGRAMLATLPDDAVRARLAGQRFQSLTPRTISDMDALLRELAAVRAQGYASESEETNENVCCVGVAIRGRDGDAQYAISVSMPTFRAEEAPRTLAIQQLLRAQRKIEQFLRTD
ncbi:MAG: IclR family transcriptional regulator [Oscillospiraceae bacterium]|jgi:IclR family KDG regulon transcriptional repressor|nr:IclR family transcriptional regulator [Oscillospiraceae bacterium]